MKNLFYQHMAVSQKGYSGDQQPR